jgi:hypothetical protein
MESLTVWIPVTIAFGLAAFALIFAFVIACEKI